MNPELRRKFSGSPSPYLSCICFRQNEIPEKPAAAIKLGEIFSFRHIGSCLFSSGLHAAAIPRLWSVYFRLRPLFGAIDKPKDRPPRILFWSGRRIFVCRTTVALFLGNFQRRRDCALVDYGILDWIVCGDCLRLHPALGKNQSDVAGSIHLDGIGVFPQRTLLPEIFVVERRLQLCRHCI